ncbi:MAG TPA: polymorphic toxin type 28 domain-containing protein, partial [Microlunatus sp.]|nr:polymorphic toxin type 28 domain-containing protein [Microlunatus sp.]
LLQALTRRIADLRARIPDRNRVSPDNRTQLTRLQAEIERLAAERAAVEREVATADSARKIDNLGARAEKIAADLDTAEAANRNLLGSPSAAELGISPEAADALRVIAEKAYDPLGDYNRGGDGKVTNHYAAARKEAAGQRVGPADPNERPFDHIRDLQNARDAVAGARDALRNEAANPRPGITERGTRVVLEKLEQAAALLRRVDEFLGSIGWPASRPHEWVQENGRWVGQGDPAVIRPRLSGRVNRARDTAEGLDRTIWRDVSAARRPALQAERQAIMNEADAVNARLQAAQNEAGLVAEEPAIQQLENRATQLRNDTYE